MKPALHVVDWADYRARDLVKAAGGLIIGSSSCLDLIAAFLREAHQSGFVEGVERAQAAVKRAFETAEIKSEITGAGV